MAGGASTASASCKRAVEHPRLGCVTFYRRKGSKNIRLSVSATRGLLLSYPWHVSFAQAQTFLEKHEAWAIAAWEKTLDRKQQHDQNYQKISPQEVEMLRRKAKDTLLPRLAQLANQYHFVYAKSFIKNNRSNWGSCSGVNNINLNLKLIMLPEHLQDYVMLHELCHTRIKNHGPQFWALLNSVTEGRAREYAGELRKMRGTIPIFA